jgi:predicted membrane-bound spermidine synthase
MAMEMKSYRNKILFVFFFVSGFCGLLYQVVWIRLAFASFGVIAPVISVVISVFMLGLALGSWAGGKLISVLIRRTKLSAIIFYAFTEILIGIGAFAVPRLFELSETSLLEAGQSNSISYLLFSAIAIALSIFPWSVFMGATFPLMMPYIKEFDRADEQSFSFLYTANVLGAMLGALLTAIVLVEMLGFRNTLRAASAGNFLIAAVSIALGLRSADRTRLSEEASEAGFSTKPVRTPPLLHTILFSTGGASLAMEVIWTRAFTPILGTQVYSFAALLFVYLLNTWFGTYLYRRDIKHAGARPTAQLLATLAVVVFLPIVLNDPRIFHDQAVRGLIALASISPFCAILGYLTPRLIDEYSAGNPRLAGKAYAINVLGCIFGPLLASYVLLPLLGANLSLIVLAAPFLLFYLIYRQAISPLRRWIAGPLAVVLLISALFINISHENPCGTVNNDCEIRRDYAATIVSTKVGPRKMLYVNGIGITSLSPITKHMAHLPLAFHQGQPETGLTICFGMGTTYRSLLSWNIQATAVELVPSVIEAFPYYHADADELSRHLKGRIVIDDGRRFLNRTSEAFDVIVVDPPPPVEAAGSSLLYSKEFHEAVKRHLKPGGIFQTWFPFGEESIQQAIARSLVDVFPYVKVYGSVEGWGLHFLASMSPLEAPTTEKMLSRIPTQAQNDMMEWSEKGLISDLERVLSNEIPVASLLSPDPLIRITDDRPYNEYFLMRRLSRRE